MLTSLLASIQTHLFSKSYLLGSLFPLLLFLTFNGLMLQRHSEPFRAWAGRLAALDDKTLLYAAVLGGVMALAYALSTLSGWLLEALEGERAPIRWLAPLLYRATRTRERRLRERYHATTLTGHEIAQRTAAWEGRLDAAYRRGAATGACGPYPTNVMDAERAQGGLVDAYWAVWSVMARRNAGWSVPVPVLDAAVAALEEALQRHSPELDTPASRALKRAQADLREAIRFERDRLQAARIHLHTERQFTYPGTMDPSRERSTHNLLAPTIAGNIARTMRSYALTRYQLDLDIFWTRLHHSVQRASNEYFTVLQDTKTQVDSLVALAWLAGLSTAIWCALLVVVYPSLAEFLIVGIAGPLATRGLYLLACQSYRVLADVMRSCVDLFRFQLLADLHLPLPTSLDEERWLWNALGDLTGYGVEEWKPIYSHAGGGR